MSIKLNSEVSYNTFTSTRWVDNFFSASLINLFKDLSILDGSEDEIKNIIFNIEKNSNHPIAKSLCKLLIKESKELNVENIHEEKGIYIQGDINGETYKKPIKY